MLETGGQEPVSIVVALVPLRKSGRAWIQVIGKTNLGPHEDSLFQNHSLPQHVAILDGRVTSHNHSGLQEAVFTNIALLAYLGSLHHVGKGPDPGSLPDSVRFNDSRRMNENVITHVTNQ